MTSTGEWIGPCTGEHPGRYQVLKSLGRGGMGEVHLALDVHLQRQVALKVVDFSALTSNAQKEYMERFEREARVTAGLDTPYVVRVHDYFVDPIAGKAFLTMEVLKGKDLDSYLEKHGRIRQEGYSWLFEQIRYALHALATAHEAGVCHRDIKPANLFLTEHTDGTTILKVLDFGIARVLAEERRKLTMQGAVFGTPDYMSPEQIQGQKAGPESDIFSMGKVICEALTKRIPYSDPPPDIINPTEEQRATGTLVWQLLAMARGVAEEVRQLPSDLPPGCARFLGSMIDPDPKKRPDAMTACNFFSDAARKAHLAAPKGFSPSPEAKRAQPAAKVDELEPVLPAVPEKSPTLAAVTKDSKGGIVRGLPWVSPRQFLAIATVMLISLAGIAGVTTFIMRGTSRGSHDAATNQPSSALVVTDDTDPPSTDAATSSDVMNVVANARLGEDAGTPLPVVADAGVAEPVEPTRRGHERRPRRQAETGEERQARSMRRLLIRQCCEGTGIPAAVGASHCPPPPGSSEYRRLCGHH